MAAHERISWRALELRPAVDVPVGLLVLLTSSIGSSSEPHPFDPASDVSWLGAAAGLVLAVLLAARRRWPYRVLGGVVATAFAVYQASRSRPRVPAIACALISMAALQSVLVAQGQLDIAKVLSGIAIIAFAAAVGDAAQTRRALIDSITDRAVRAEQTREQEALRRVAQERLRIARELHDAAAHQIAVINLQAGAGTAALIAARYDDADHAMRSIQTAARTVLSDIAALLVVLRSSGDPRGADLAPVRSMSDLPALIDQFRAAGLTVTGGTDLGAAVPSGAADVVAFKVVQEALTNAHKHGTGGAARLEVASEADELHIVTTNPVPPFRTHPSLSGYGLTGMRERVASVHGAMRTGTTDGVFTLDVRLPLRGAV